MTQLIDVPNYGTVEFPDGMSDADITAAIKKNSMGYKSDSGTLTNIAMGALKGATDIGNTINRGFSALGDWERSKGLDLGSLVNGTPDKPLAQGDNRPALSAYFNENADPNSLAFKGGALGSQIAGTAGVGGLLAKPLAAIAPRLAASVASGGFALGEPGGSMLGNAALRAVGGAINGGVSAGMVDPSNAGTGAAIGAVIPGATQAASALMGGIKKAAQFGAKTAIGASTGAGAESLSQAYQAGKAGNTTFLDNMRGNVPMTDVLDQAKQALTQMRMDRAAEYRSGMADISKDKTVLDFSPIEDALSSLQSMGSYKGQAINKNAAGTVQELADQVQKWSALDPAEFHTPEGLDALKQSIGDIRDATQFGTPARKAADTVYNAVKNQITMQAPTYANTMRAYSEASDTLNEVTKALSLGNKAAADTGMRKLQSLMRNNAQSNYGNRLDLAKTLQTQGGQDILPAVAGQALNSWTPRGMVGAIENASIPLTAAYMHSPAALAAIPFTSPRLMGETAYGLGAAGRNVGQGMQPITQGLLGPGMRALASDPAYQALMARVPAASYLSNP